MPDAPRYATLIPWLLGLIVLGGLGLNLTPCILPLIPINLAIIGAGAQAGSRRRGFALGGAYAAGLKGLPVLVFTLCSLGAYALSLAPVTWVLIAEIFPNRVRGAAVSVAVSALWVACFLLTFAFPLLQRTAGIAATFWIYAAICFAGFFFVRAKVPETKGRSLEQIEHHLGL